MRDEKDRTNYDREHDDIDSIVRAKAERAVRLREVSVAGLMRMLAHPARFDDSSYDDIVIDPGLIDAIGASPLREEAIAALRSMGSASKRVVARAQYAIVRLVGADAPEVAEGLARKGDGRIAVITALSELAVVPASIAPLLSKALSKSSGASDARTAYALVGLLTRLPPAVGAPVVLQALGDDELRRTMMEALARSGASAQLPFDDVLMQRFDEAAKEIESSRTAGFPSRNALTMAAGIATLVQPDVRLARRALAFFDLAPGVLPAGGPIGTSRDAVIAERLLPFCRLLEACVDALDDAERDRLATFTSAPLPERLGPASAAWARLPPDRAAAIAKSWSANGPALEDQRWSAAVRSLAALPVARPDLLALVPARIARAPRP